MSFKNIFFLLSLFFFNALGATLEDDQESFCTAAENNDPETIKKILEKYGLEDQKKILQHVPISKYTSFDSFTSLCLSKEKCHEIIRYLAEHPAFDPNFINEKQAYLAPFLSQLINYAARWEEGLVFFGPPIEKILNSDKCTEKTIIRAFNSLTNAFILYRKSDTEQKKIKELLTLIKNRVEKKEVKFAFRDACIYHDKELVLYFLELYPEYDFNTYPDVFSKIILFDQFTQQEKKEFINFLLDHDINYCYIDTYKKHAEFFDDPNRLSIDGLTDIRMLSYFGLSMTFIITTLADFMTFKPAKIKEEASTEKDKKDIKSENSHNKTEAAREGSNKEKDTAENKLSAKKEENIEEETRNSLWHKTKAHAKPYVLDLWKHPRNHKKLAIAPIAIFCLALKDKIPYLKLT